MTRDQQHVQYLIQRVNRQVNLMTWDALSLAELKARLAVLRAFISR